MTSPSDRPTPARDVLVALAVMALTTAVAAAVRATFRVPDVEMLFLLGVMIVALTSGRRASILAAALAVACYDFFFVPPSFTLDVSDVRYFLSFAMMLGVDLRTPLAAITGAGTLLLDEGIVDPALRRELTQTAVDEAERLERLVSNLLDMPRLESGVVEPRRERVPLVEVVGAALGRLEPRLAKRPIEIEIPDDVPLLSIDPSLGTQPAAPPEAPLADRAPPPGAEGVGT